MEESVQQKANHLPIKILKKFKKGIYIIDKMMYNIYVIK